MAKVKNVQRISNKKRGRPKVRFSIWGLILIFFLSFAACFGLYMMAANKNENFFKEEFDGVVVEKTTVPKADSDDEEQVGDSENVPSDDNSSSAVTVTNPVPQSAAADASYFENACLVTDSTLLGMTNFKDVIGSASLSASGCNDVKVESNYGTVTVYETLQIKKPMNIYLMLGSDIGSVAVEDMIANYTTLVSKLHSFNADMHIYVMQLPPVAADSETVTNEMINDYNNKLLAMANTVGVYCIDTNTALKSAEGTLSAEYWSAETASLTAAAYDAIAGYILTHTV